MPTRTLPALGACVKSSLIAAWRPPAIGAHPLVVVLFILASGYLNLTARNASALDLAWEFGGASPLTATGGSATITYYDTLGSGWGPLTTQFNTPTAFGLPAFPDGGSGSVMSFPATTPNQGYRVNSGASSNAYTMIWDYLSPAASDGKWRALYQANTTNSDDGEFFILNSPSGGIGINGTYQGSISPNAWNRIAVTRDSVGTMNKYINGTLVGTQSASDARFNLSSFFYILTDEDNETQPGYLSSFRYLDSAFSTEQIRLLGNVSSAGATVPGPTIPDPLPEPPDPLPPLFGRTLVMGHRGGGTLAPENTLAAIAKGFEVGDDLIEVDIHLTSDGHAVVLHDDTLDRTTNGSGPVSNLTLAQVKALDAGSWYGPQYAGEKIPTLTEALQFINGRGRILLDVKVSPDAALRNAISAALAASGASLDDIWVWPSSSSYSSDPRFGTAEIQLLSTVPGNLGDANLQALKSSGIDGMSVADGSLTQEAINAFHRNDMWVDVYTISDPVRMQQLIAMGVDSIETDRPDLMANLLFAGDYNQNNAVDAADYVAWRNSLGSIPATPGSAADGNANGTVEQFDHNVWRARFGRANASAADSAATFADLFGNEQAVPEPATGILILTFAATTLVAGRTARTYENRRF